MRSQVFTCIAIQGCTQSTFAPLVRSLELSSLRSEVRVRAIQVKRTESRSPGFSRRRQLAALARLGSSRGIDPEGIGICSPGTPSPHLHEGSARQRVCTRDAKPSRFGNGGGETAGGVPDPWKQDAA